MSYSPAFLLNIIGVAMASATRQLSGSIGQGVPCMDKPANQVSRLRWGEVMTAFDALRFFRKLRITYRMAEPTRIVSTAQVEHPGLFIDALGEVSRRPALGNASAPLSHPGREDGRRQGTLSIGHERANVPFCCVTKRAAALVEMPAYHAAQVSPRKHTLNTRDRAHRLPPPAEREQERAFGDRFDVVSQPSLDHEQSTCGQLDDLLWKA
jgi:hypothetical protein